MSKPNDLQFSEQDVIPFPGEFAEQVRDIIDSTELVGACESTAEFVTSNGFVLTTDQRPSSEPSSRE